MRHLRALNPACNHRNLRLFDAQRRIISHQCSGFKLCVCGARMATEKKVAHVHGCGTRACVTLARAHVCVQDMTHAHAKMKC